MALKCIKECSHIKKFSVHQGNSDRYYFVLENKILVQMGPKTPFSENSGQNFVMREHSRCVCSYTINEIFRLELIMTTYLVWICPQYFCIHRQNTASHRNESRNLSGNCKENWQRMLKNSHHIAGYMN